MTQPETAMSPSTPPFTMSYQVVGAGWARAELATPDQHVRLSASYLGDALGDLLRTIELLWDGATAADVYWFEEPGHYHWEFRDHGGSVRLRVLAGVHTSGLDEQFVDGQGREVEAHERGKEFPIFEVTSSREELTQAIVNAAANVLAVEGLVSYLERWKYRFPLGTLNSLELKVGRPLTIPPIPRPTIPHPDRGTVERLWGDYLDGRVAAEEVVAALAEFPRDPFDPILRSGCWMLSHRIRHGALDAAILPKARSEFAGWLASAERYAREPLAWHASERLRALATQLNYSSDVRGQTEWASRVIPREDAIALIEGLGRMPPPEA